MRAAARALDAVTWLGDITAVMAGDDASAKRRLACRLISLGLPEVKGAVPDELVEEGSGDCWYTKPV